MATYRLLQARNPDDPVRNEERVAFATQLGVPVEHVLQHDLLSETTTTEAVCDGVDAVLIGGSGHYSIYDDQAWIGPFVETVRGLVQQQFPTFASCFGFQAMVVALGCAVERDDDAAEVGTFTIHRLEPALEDPLFRDIPASFTAQLGHKDRAMALPEGAILLAKSDRCPYQAIRVGEKVWATQFHPELTGDANRERFMRYFDDYAKAFGESTAQDLLDSFQDSPHADALLARFHAFVLTCL